MTPVSEGNEMTENTEFRNRGPATENVHDRGTKQTLDNSEREVQEVEIARQNGSSHAVLLSNPNQEEEQTDQRLSRFDSLTGLMRNLIIGYGYYADTIKTEHRELQVHYQNLYRVHKGLLHQHQILSDNCKALQTENLAQTDIHCPKSDSTIIQAFHAVNQKIANFIVMGVLKNSEILPIMVFYTTCMPGSVKKSPKLGQNSSTNRDLLMNSIWRFFIEQLLDRSLPFQAFGGSTAEALNRAYSKLYPNHRVDMDAARWKATTVQQLIATQDEDELKKKLSMIASAFVVRFIPGLEQNAGQTTHNGLGPRDSTSKFATYVEMLLGESGSLGKKFVKMAKEVINFSQLVAGERAGYSLDMPNLLHRRPAFWKSIDDRDLSKGVNTRLGTRTEEDRSGFVLYVVTPYLVKWGTGHGEKLEKGIVLVKAYPRMEDED